MRVFIWQLYGNPREIADTIAEVASSLKTIFFTYPDESEFDSLEDYGLNKLSTFTKKESVIEALEPRGSGWGAISSRLGIFRPLKWEKTSKRSTTTPTEIVGTLGFVPSQFEGHPNTLQIHEFESQSNFLDSLLSALNKAFEQVGFLRTTTDFKMQYTTARYSDVSSENRDLLREVKALRAQLEEVMELGERVKTAEREAENNKAKKKELENLRQQIIPASYQLSSGTLSVKEERLNALLQTQRIYYRNLNELEKRAAYFGLNVPIDVVNQIDYFKGKVGEIEKEVSALQQNK